MNRGLDYKDNDDSSWDTIYPSNVYDVKTDKKKDIKAEGFKSGLTLLVFFSFLAFIVLNSILKNTFGISSIWAFLIVFILVGFCAFIAFRFLVFKEDERMEEFENEDMENLSRYFTLVNTGETIEDIGSLRIPLYKFITGEYATCIKLSHGSCDKLKILETRNFMEDVYKIIGKYKLNFRQVIMDEIFDDSKECRDYMNIVNNISVPEMQRNARLIAEGLLSTTRQNSRVDCTYLIVYAKNSYEKQFLLSAIVAIRQRYAQCRTVYRNIELLWYKPFIDICGQYLGMDVIDLSTIRPTGINSTTLAQYAKKISTVEIETLDGSKIQYKAEIIEQAIHGKIKDL